ncbi:MAG: hypothetical protein KAS67_06325, partial [Thermoplasmata archaeon]|nr:hypothetical protein [Thermoplasmata archaeon]
MIILSAVIIPNSSIASSPPLSVCVQGDGWNDTFENTTRVSEYNNVRINRDVSLNVSAYWKDWTKHGIVVDTDAVYDSTHVRFPYVLKEDGIYKMWYSGYEGSTYNIIYATSGDGHNWNKQGIVLSPGGVYDSVSLSQPYVLNDEGTYKMWYSGYDGTNNRILYATSADGIAWTKQTMVLDIGGLQESADVISPCVLIEDGFYKMWYNGRDGGSNWRIFYATSVDGITWVKQGLVMDYGASTPELNGVIHPKVIKVDGIYYMWYTAKALSNRLTILSATSIDGINWNKKGLDINYGDVAGGNDSVSEPCVIREDDGSFKMWYSGTDWDPVNKYRTLLATMNYKSFEPMDWDKQGVAIEIGAYPEESTGTSAPSIIQDEGIYKMWYTGYDNTNYRILYASSADGVSWNKQDVVLNIGTGGETDDTHVAGPHVMKEGATYKMWYSGHDGANYRIHYATSIDGTTWSKQGVANGLDLGIPGSYDDFGTGSPHIIKEDTTYKMWYSGYEADASVQVIYATSPDGINWVKQGVAIPNSGPFDSMIAGEPIVLGYNNEYHMWYRGTPAIDVGHILYASSSDGLTWTKQGQALVAGSSGESDDSRVISPRVIFDSDGYAKMWYVGHDDSNYRVHYAKTPLHILFNSWDKQGVAFPLSASPEQDCWINSGQSVIKDDGIYKMWYMGMALDSRYRLFYATSADGITWNKQGKIMDLGTPSGTEDYNLGFTYVLKEDGIYKMWYAGYDGATWRIHYATSIDGMSWTRLGDVLTPGGLPGGTDDKWTIGQTVLKENGEYRMWYCGFDTSDVVRVHLATSPDGITWTKKGVVVDIGSPGDIDDAGVSSPDVHKIDDLYYMFFTGSDGSLAENHYATSSDGENWTKHGLSLPVSASGQDDSIVSIPRVLIDTDGYAKMWYAGVTSPENRYRIFWARMPITYFGNGNLTSEYIELPAGKAWNSLNITKSEPSLENNITVTILDNSTGLPIIGYENMTGTDIDISGINSVTYPSIRLYGLLSGNGSVSPELHDWSINWTEVPMMSYVDAISPYWQTTSPLALTATTKNVEYAEFWYIYSADNSTWGLWTYYSNETSASSWTSSFNFPTGMGYYQFYSRAGNVTSSFYEDAPASADAFAAYDTQDPITSVDAIAPYWHNTDPLPITAAAVDNGPAGIGSVELWYSFEGAPYINFGADGTAPYSWNFNWPTGDSNYTFYSRGYDNASNYEAAPVAEDTSGGYDSTGPESSVDTISPYTYAVPLVIMATANDAMSGVAQVELFYKSSLDNATWNAWQSFGVDVTDPYSFDFDFPDSDGYYEFYSVATDDLGNIEAAPASADEIAEFETGNPITLLNEISPYWHITEPIGLTALAKSTEYVEFWYRHAPDNSSWGLWTNYLNDTAGPVWTESFDFPDGEGYYELYSRGGNQTSVLYEAEPADNDTVCAYDNTDTDTSVDAITPYWYTTSPLAITAAASDGTSGVASVELWYSHEGGLDTLFGIDNDGAPYQWDFNWPSGQGNYTFYSRGHDIAGNYETAPGVQDTLAGYDFTVPTSSVDVISPYWSTSTPITITATAGDGTSGVAQVELFYRYAPDNSTWGGPLSFGADNSFPYSFSFTFPDGDGYYQFYTQATDVAGNIELAPGIYDEYAALDQGAPISFVNGISPYWKTSLPASIIATAVDTIDGVSSVEFWYRYAPDNVSFGSWNLLDTDTTLPYSIDFNAPDGEGYYELYSRATDGAGNYESSPVVEDAR